VFKGRYALHMAPAFAGIGLLAFLFLRFGAGNVQALLLQTGWRFGGMVILFGAQEIVRSIAVLQSLHPVNRPPLRHMLQIRFMGEMVRSLTLTGPFLAEPIRAWFIRRQGVRMTEAAAATIADFAVHSFMSAALTVAAAVYFLRYVPYSGPIRIAAFILFYGAAGYLVLAAWALHRKLRLARGLQNLLSRAGMPEWSRRLEGLRLTEDVFFSMVCDRRGTIPKLLLLQSAAHLLLLLETWWAITAMGVDVSFLTSALAETLTKVVNLAFLAGVAEGAYAVLFGALGLAAAAGFTLSLLKRIRSLVFAIAGLASLTLLTARPGERLMRERATL
jgi:hypothetical protein